MRKRISLSRHQSPQFSGGRIRLALLLLLALILVIGQGLAAQGALAQGATQPFKPTIDKYFDGHTGVSGDDDYIHVGQVAELKFILRNPAGNNADLTRANFDDLLPTGVYFLPVGAPVATSNTCGGTISITNGTLLGFDFGTIPLTPGFCTITFNVTANSPSTFTNTTGPINAENAFPTDNKGSAVLTVLSALVGPQINKSFAPQATAPGGPSTITIDVVNPNPVPPFPQPSTVNDLINVNFTDNLPVGMTIRTVGTTNANCLGGTGTLTAPVNGTAITLTNGRIPAAATCRITVGINAPTTLKKHTNTIPANSVTFNGGTNPNKGEADLFVANPPTVSKAFGGSSFIAGQSTTLTLTITNPSTNPGNLTNITLNDNLPGSLVIDNPNGLSFSPTPNCLNVSAVPGGGSIAVTGGTLTPGESCAITVNVTDPIAETLTNTTGPVSGLSSGVTLTGGTASDDITVSGSVLPPALTKTFGTPSIKRGDKSLVTITITNNNPSTSFRGLRFTDTLATAGNGDLIVTNPSGATNTCGGTLNAAAYSKVIILSGVTLAANSSCQIQFSVTGVVAGAYQNSVTATTSNTGNSNTPIANLTVQNTGPGTGTDLLTMNKAFAPATLSGPGTSVITFTLGNINTFAQFGVSFSDTLPAGVTVTNNTTYPTAPAPQVTSTCGGTLTAVPYSNAISLSNGTVPANGTCVITVRVTANSSGTFDNQVTNLKSTNVTGPDISSNLATLTVDPSTTFNPPTVSKAFDPAKPLIAIGQTTTLTFTFINPNAATALTNANFTDNFPPEIEGVIGSGGGTCVTGQGGTLTVAGDKRSLIASIPSFAANTTCTFTVTVTGRQQGTASNITGNANANNAGPGTKSNTATVQVEAPPTISKQFGSGSITAGGTTSLTLRIGNPSGNPQPLTGVSLIDDLPISNASDPLTQMIAVSVDPVDTATCGVGATFTITNGGAQLTFTGGTIPLNTTCVLTATVKAPAIGSYANTTQPPTSSNGGTAAGGGSATLTTTSITQNLRVNKQFNPITQPVDTNSRMTITITNPVNQQQTGVQFTDTFPTGLDFAVLSGTEPNLTSDCGALPTYQYANGGTPASITLAGGVLAPNGSCTIAIDVTSSLPNENYTNVVSVISLQVSTPTTASAGLTFIGPPDPLKTITPALINAGDTAALRITLDNPNVRTAINNVKVIDTFPLGLTVNTPLPALPATCGNGATLTKTINGSGQTVLTLNNGTINAGSGTTCVITATITGNPGIYTNTINAGDITTSNGGPNRTPTSADLEIRGFSVGNRLWFDTNNNGLLDTAEIPAANFPPVSVSIFASDTNGNPIGAAHATVNTDTNGYYRFDGVPNGTYVISVDKSNWTGAGKLVGYASSTGNLTQTATAPDSNDNGKDPATYTTAGVLSSPFTLAVGSVPTGEDQTAPAVGSRASYDNNGASIDPGDAFNNLTLDFGFYRLTVGDTVWNDNGGGTPTNFDNGKLDAGEVGIPGVTLQLLKGGTFVAQTTTDSSGKYLFNQQTTAAGVGTGEPLLPGSDYTIVIPSSQTSLNNLISSTDITTSPNPTNTGNGVNSDDNGLGAAGANITSVTSSAFTLNVTTATNTAGAAANNLTATTDNPTLDFGFHVGFSVGNRLWYDNNNNGKLDAGENGIGGVSVTIFPADPTTGLPNGPAGATVTTDASGYYRFDGIPLGTYVVRVNNTNWTGANPLVGYASSTSYITQNGASTPDSFDNGVDPASYVTSGVTSTKFTVGLTTLPLGEDATNPTGSSHAGYGTSGATDDAGDAFNNLTVDFGFYRLSVGDTVWNDTGAGAAFNNGRIDAGEPGIPGVTVQLFKGGVLVAQTTTNGTGNYLFNQQTTAAGVPTGEPLLPGTDYSITIPKGQVALNNFLSSTDLSSTTNPTVTGNGVNSDDNGTGTSSANTTDTITNTFSLNVAGTLNTAGGVLLTNARTDNPTLDFGFHLTQAGTYSIGNRVFFDNGNGGGNQNNGKQEVNEVGIDNVNVLLYLNNAQNQPTTLIQSQATRNGGYYRFDAVAPGSYTVIVDVANSPALNNLIASNFTFVDYTAVGDKQHKGSQTPLPPNSPIVPNGIPSGVIVIAPNSSQTLNELDVNGAIPAASHGPNGDVSDVLTVDFGFYQPASTLYSVGNRVFLDNGVGGTLVSANNGIQDGNEPGIGGVKVNLYAADGNGNPTGGILNTATTDANGYYRFDGIPPGNYVVVVDVTGSPALNGYAVSAVTSTDITTPGDKANKGQQTALPGGSVLPGGIRSGSFTIPSASPIINEPDVTATGPGAHGPTTDANDVLTFDFGFYINPANAYSIGNRVFLDEGGAGARDGIQNNAETGLSAVPVKLFAADSGGNPTGTALQSAITDASGYYRFDGVTAGRYVVVVDLPSLNSGATKYQVTPVTFTSISLATDDKQNKGAQTLLGPGSPLPGGIVGPAITISAAGNLLTGEGDVSTGQGANGPGGDTKDNLTLDFGVVTIPSGTYSIGNRVFLDNGNGGAPNDGTQQLGEPGIPGVVVKLYAESGGIPTGAALQTTTTDSGGYYRFDGVTPGSNYIVVVDQPGSAPLTGLTVSGTTTTTFTTTDDQKNKGQQAALPGGSVLPGGIRSGVITVPPAPANEPDVTGAGAGAHGPTGDGNDLLTADFGFYQNPATGYSIGNRVFLDNGISTIAQPGGVTGDGKQNGAEPGIPNVVVKLFYADAAGNPVGASPIGTQTTDGSGYYRFDGLNPSNYVVVIDKAASSTLNGYTPTSATFPTSATDKQNNGKTPLPQGSPVPGGIPSSLVTISAGGQPTGEPDTTGTGASAHGPGTDPNDILTVDFGFVASTGTYSIGNRVWNDQYKNGVEQVNDEKGISDVALQLWRADANGNPTTQVGKTLSDQDGYYRFDGLTAGDYVVIVDVNASPNLKGLYSTDPMVDAQTNTADHLHNGMPKQMQDGSAVPGGISSGKISLGARPLEPLGETVPGSYGSRSVFTVGGAPEASDDRGNLTIDFGFYLPAGGVGVADPALVKLVDPALAQPGETVNYTLTVTNNSGVAALGVIVSDPVPNILQIVSATTPQGTSTINGQTVTFNVGTVNPGQVIVLRITARVRPDVIPPVIVTNEATLTGTNLLRKVVSSATLRITRGGLPATGEHPEEPPVSGVPLVLAGVVVLAAGALVIRRRTTR